MTITEKIAYIQGLFDGLGLDKSESGEARVLSEMLDVMKEMGAQLEEVDATLDEFGEEIVAEEETEAVVCGAGIGALRVERGEELVRIGT